MDIATLLIQLLSGAAGGNIAGAVLKNLSLGGLGNTLAGLVGGGLGSQVAASLAGATATAAAGPDLDISGLLSQVLGGGAGGGAATVLIGMLKQMFQR